MMIFALFLAGTQAAYPQKFSEHLQSSVDYWGTLLTWPTATKSKNLSKQWEDLRETSLSKQEVFDLESVLRIADYHQGNLKKKDKQFLFKQGHLAIYLSGMNPEVSDEFNRAGIWKLSYPDAKRYGLIVNDHVDERKDILKSTAAARLYYEDLKKIHGGKAETVFVLGAANWKKSAAELIKEVEDDLSVLRFVRRDFETTDGVVAKGSFMEQSFESEIIASVLVDQSELELDAFRRINPTLVGDLIPAGESVKLPMQLEANYVVSLTDSYKEKRVRRLDSLKNAIKNDIPSPKTHQVVSYRVKSGDVLGKIAEHYDVGVSTLKKWNDLRSDRIDINQKLTIYLKKGKKIPSSTIAESKPKPEVKLTEKENASFTIYEVQPGDTLWAISKQFEGVKPEEIMKWNNIGENLSIGQKLKIKTR